MDKDVLGEDVLAIEKTQNNEGGIPGYENLPPEEQIKELQKMFRDVFSGENGKIVLTVILEDLYYFAECRNAEDRALNNYAKTLVSKRLGIASSLDITKGILNAY